MNKSLKKIVSQAKIIFWDFDGVIKDSVEVKSVAFESLFSEYGENLVNRVSSHHKKNAGLSRFDKIPLYLSWTNETITKKKIKELNIRFSLIVKESVISSKWVDGVIEFIDGQHNLKKQILLTATPIEEIEEILEKLNIKSFFYKVYGFPSNKTDGINEVLRDLKIESKHAIMLGDSMADYVAAENNKVLFLLRATDLNKNLQVKCKNRIFKDFTDE